MATRERSRVHVHSPVRFWKEGTDEAMLGRLIAIVSLTALLVGCEGDGGSEGTAAPIPAEPTMSSAAEAVCADLLTYRGQVEQIMGDQDGSDMIGRIQDASSSAADGLRGRSPDLDDDLATDVDGVTNAIDAVGAWRPDDADSLDDRMGETAATIAAFERDHC